MRKFMVCEKITMNNTSEYEITAARKKQRASYNDSSSQPSQHDDISMDTDTQQQPAQLLSTIGVSTTTKGGPSGPPWSCRGCGRCNIHHTTAMSGCWACLQVKINGPTFDADRWGDFVICHQMKAARLKEQAS